MTELELLLKKRKKIAVFAIFVFAFIITFVDYNFDITPLTYFEPQYNTYAIYFLIVYKLVELPILYYILFHRNIALSKDKTSNSKEYLRLLKHTKLLLFLIPQGNIIFGIIAYKLSTDLLYSFLFISIAFMTLFLVPQTSQKLLPQS